MNFKSSGDLLNFQSGGDPLHGPPLSFIAARQKHFDWRAKPFALLLGFIALPLHCSIHHGNDGRGGVGYWRGKKKQMRW